MKRLACIVLTALLSTGTMSAAHATASGSAVATATTVRDVVLRLSAKSLQVQGLHLDEASAQLSTSHVLPPDAEFEVVALWRADAGLPRQPLAFALVPRGGSRTSALRAYLSAPLMRDVLVAGDKLARGARLRCEQLAVERKPVRTVPTQPIDVPCALDGTQVLRRSLVRGEPVRFGDIGPEPAVVAQAPVSVRVVVGRVALETPGVALADAQVGERVRVRLPGAGRPVDARVLADNVVVLEEGK